MVEHPPRRIPVTAQPTPHAQTVATDTRADVRPSSARETFDINTGCTGHGVGFWRDHRLPRCAELCRAPAKDPTPGSGLPRIEHGTDVPMQNVHDPTHPY